MFTQAAEPTGIAERLAELEQQCQRLKSTTRIALLLAAASALILVVLLFIGLPRLRAIYGDFGTVEATRIDIQNNEGVFIRVQDTSGQSLASVKNDYGELRITLFRDIVIYDRDHNRRARLTVDKNGVRLTPIIEDRKSD